MRFSLPGSGSQATGCFPPLAVAGAVRRLRMHRQERCSTPSIRECRRPFRRRTRTAVARSSAVDLISFVQTVRGPLSITLRDTASVAALHGTLAGAPSADREFQRDSLVPLGCHRSHHRKSLAAQTSLHVHPAVRAVGVIRHALIPAFEIPDRARRFARGRCTSLVIENPFRIIQIATRNASRTDPRFILPLVLDLICDGHNVLPRFQLQIRRSSRRTQNARERACNSSNAEQSVRSHIPSGVVLSPA